MTYYHPAELACLSLQPCCASCNLVHYGLQYQSLIVWLQWNTWSKDQEEHDHKRSDYNKDEIAAGFQNFLICIEMFFAALAHAYAFPPKEYMDPGWTVKSGFLYSLRIMFNVRDVVDDVEDVVQDTVRAT